MPYIPIFFRVKYVKNSQGRKGIKTAPGAVTHHYGSRWGRLWEEVILARTWDNRWALLFVEILFTISFFYIVPSKLFNEDNCLFIWITFIFNCLYMNVRCLDIVLIMSFICHFYVVMTFWAPRIWLDEMFSVLCFVVLETVISEFY